MNRLPLLNGTTGLNNRVDPLRVKYSAESGVSDLVTGINITIDQTGMPHSRDGKTVISNGNFHSVFCDGGDCFTGEGIDMYQVNPDKTLRGIANGKRKHNKS